MRAFTAIFYLLFFSLTAWGQSSRVVSSVAVKSGINVAVFSPIDENAGIYAHSNYAVASSTQVSTCRGLKG